MMREGRHIDMMTHSSSLLFSVTIALLLLSFLFHLLFSLHLWNYGWFVQYMCVEFGRDLCLRESSLGLVG